MGHRNRKAKSKLLCTIHCRHLFEKRIHWCTQDLIRRLLEPFSSLPPPTTPFGALDAALLKVSKQLSRIPPSLFIGLEDEPEVSPLCPLDEIATDDIKISCASNLDVRLKALRAHNLNPGSTPQITPEIRLESDNEGTPEISLSTPESLSARRKNVPTTLVASKIYNGGNTHEKHSSALLRLLYLHSCINPGNHSPHIPSLLVPLYSVLCQEIEPQDVAHAEADTFWLFEAVIGEFSELEDEEGGNLWMKKLSERLEWADPELSESLVRYQLHINVLRSVNHLGIIACKGVGPSASTLFIVGYAYELVALTSTDIPVSVDGSHLYSLRRFRYPPCTWCGTLFSLARCVNETSIRKSIV